MKAALVKESFVRELSSRYTKKEAESLFFIFLEEYFGLKRIDFLSEPQLSLEKESGKMEQALERLKEGEPYQHILGEVDFANLKLKVSKAALIPRPETEELVYLMKEELDQKKAYRILDIGTGTGCIALACKAFFPNAKLTGMEKSRDALKLAEANAQMNKLNLNFFPDDILHPSVLDSEKWDVIVSNPPYIARWEAGNMDHLVTGYEPEEALFAPDDDPLLFYRAILNFAKDHLNPGGTIFLEINERLGKETAELYAEANYGTTLKKDMSGKERFVIARK